MINPVKRTYRNMKHKRGMKKARLNNMEQKLRNQAHMIQMLEHKISYLENQSS